MRVTRIEIRQWRNLRNVTLEIPEDATLICVVGENGAGKTHLLELVAATAHRLGISPGLDLHRGDPFADIHECSVTTRFEALAADFIATREPGPHAQLAAWDKSLTLESTRSVEQGWAFKLSLGGVEQEHSETLARAFVEYVKSTKETHHIYLDADRSYPKTEVHPSMMGEAFGRNYSSKEWSKERAHLSSRTLYDEWSLYMISQESQSATRHQQLEREARATDAARPEFVDEFDGYKSSLQEVLPHLRFEGVNPATRQIVFDSTGLKLQFYQLSGGEREIAFIVGQIERFKLRSGLLLIDEPELHLNPDLIRVWVAYLRDTITEGQAWIATHSLEAVEVAGEAATFVFEKNPATRLVERVRPWSESPTLAILARAIGSPAFSLTRLRFLFIEGEQHSGEKERFFRVCGDPTRNRFIAGNGCTEVVKKFDAVTLISAESNEAVQVGAVLDSDFRDPRSNRQLVGNRPIHVLGCHEIENLFLHPAALSDVMVNLGRERDITAVLVECADRSAGGWILQYAYARTENLPEPWEALKTRMWNSNWLGLEAEWQEVEEVVNQAVGNVDGAARLRVALVGARDAYARVRAAPDLWAKCMGKQTLSAVAANLGFNSADFLEAAVTKAWLREVDPVPMPPAVIHLREYVSGI